MTRIPRRLAVVGVVALLLSGCGGQLRPGAAALVGEDRITSERLRQVVERSLADPQAASQFGADSPGFHRQALSRLINRVVLRQAAQDRGVTVIDEQVQAQLDQFVTQVGSREELEQQAAQSGIAPEDLMPFVRDIVLEERLGEELTEGVPVSEAELRAAYDENLARYDQVRSRHILVRDEQTARSLLEQVRIDPSRFSALAAQFSIDTSNKDQGGDLGLAGRGQFVPPFEEVLFATPPGTFGIAQTDFGWHVIAVTDRQTTTLEQATPELRRIILQDRRREATSSLLRETADRLGVRVNPRFGRWDSERGAVVPDDTPNGVLSPAPSGTEDEGPLGGGPGGGPGGGQGGGQEPAPPAPSPATR